jgi:hypothetical protein
MQALLVSTMGPAGKALFGMRALASAAGVPELLSPPGHSHDPTTKQRRKNRTNLYRAVSRISGVCFAEPNGFGGV